MKTTIQVLGQHVGLLTIEFDGFRNQAGANSFSLTPKRWTEQTLGRGLRRMYRGTDLKEMVSVVGTPAFMDFVESIKSEGVELEHREYKNLSNLDVANFGHQKITVQEFSEEQKREIVFKDIANDEISHTTELGSGFVADYQSVIGYFAQVIMKELR